MRDFDHARQQRTAGFRDLDFRIGGETFRLLPAVRPEVVSEFDSVEQTRPARCRCGHAVQAHSPLTDACTRQGCRCQQVLVADPGVKGTSASEVLSVVDRMVAGMIEPEGHDRWRRLRERTDDPLTLDDMLDLANYLLEAQTGRPTEPPAPSTNGAASGTPTLTVASSSPAEPTGHPA